MKFVTAALVFLVACFTAVDSLANDVRTVQVSQICELLLDPSAEALAPEVAEALATFPNVIHSWVDRLDMKYPGDDVQSAAFLSSRDRVSIVNHRDLPATFTDLGRGGITYYPVVDMTALLGKAVIGYFDTVKDFIKHEDGIRNLGRHVDRQYFSGRVEAITEERHLTPTGQGDNTWPSLHYVLAVVTPGGERSEVRFMKVEAGYPPVNLMILEPKASEEELLLRSFNNANVEGMIEAAFGTPASKEDFDMAGALVETALAVPPSYGSSAVMKILLGRQVRGGESYKHFALARGKDRYREPALKKFIGPLYAYMELAGLFGPNVGGGSGHENSAPEWIAITHKTARAEVFAKIWRDLVRAKGGGVKEIVAAKERPAGSVKVTRSDLVPGVILIVKDKIGMVSAAEGLAEFPVMNRGKDSESFGVRPTGRLEVLSKVRKIDGSNMVRLKDLATGKVGEAFLITTIVSTQLAGD